MPRQPTIHNNPQQPLTFILTAFTSHPTDHSQLHISPSNKPTPIVTVPIRWRFAVALLHRAKMYDSTSKIVYVGKAPLSSTISDIPSIQHNFFTPTQQHFRPLIFRIYLRLTTSAINNKHLSNTCGLQIPLTRYHSCNIVLN